MATYVEKPQNISNDARVFGDARVYRWRKITQ